MIKKKIAVLAVVGMLAMCVGLTACGGSSTSSSAASSSASSSAAASSASSTAASSSASSSAASSSASSSTDGSIEDTAIAFWEGTLPDGQIVSYADDLMNGVAALSVAKSDFSDGKVWYGPAVVDADGSVTITDAETGTTIKYFRSGAISPTMTMAIEGYDETELSPITVAEYKEFVKKFAASPEGKKLKKEIKSVVKKIEKKAAKRAKKLMNAFDKLDDSTILYWEGTFGDDITVNYMDNPEKSEAYLAAVKNDLSDGAVWYGTYATSEDGKAITLTDSESDEKVVYEVVESVPDTSLKLAFSGVGEVDLKPVTKADFVKGVEELAKLAEAEAEAAASASSASASAAK